MAISDFEIFAQVVSMGSLSAAGRDLGFSPAMVSKRIKGLESRLGVRLIQRTTRDLTLTDTGQAFYERAVTIIQAIEEAEEFVSRRAEIASGRLRVAAPTCFGRMHLLPKLREFLDANPGIDLEIELTDRPVNLIAERFDAMVGIGMPEDSSLVMRRIAPARRIVCASPSYLEKFGQPQDLHDLASHRLFAIASESVWRFQIGLAEFSIPVRSVIKTDNTEVVREGLLAGMGIALASSWEVSDDLANGRLVELFADNRCLMESSVYVLYPSRRQLATAVRAFIDHVANAHGQEPSGSVRPAAYGMEMQRVGLPPAAMARPVRELVALASRC